MLSDFDSSGVGVANGNFFSLPFTIDDSKVVLMCVPWDVTVSYGHGTAKAPAALIEASSQLDLYDSSAPDAWRAGVATLPIDHTIEQLSNATRPVAKRVIEHLEAGGDQGDVEELIQQVNGASRQMNEIVYNTVSRLLDSGKIVGIVGGDHSTPYSLIKALGERYDNFGILHIDAHRDLRVAYEGFEYSHASVMYNVLRDVESMSSLVQVGVRDLCDQEQQLAMDSDRVSSFEDLSLAREQFEGRSWGDQCREIVSRLPQHIYVSFDIDGLDISYCPHTGTPVPGGLSYNQAVYLLEQIVASGRVVVGFDVVEVNPSDESVVDLATGARILYKLCGI
ncbi:MAG: agmatinase family protein [Rikenellaceae bacterium]